MVITSLETSKMMQISKSGLNLEMALELISEHNRDSELGHLQDQRKRKVQNGSTKTQPQKNGNHGLAHLMPMIT